MRKLMTCAMKCGQSTPNRSRGVVRRLSEVVADVWPNKMN